MEAAIAEVIQMDEQQMAIQEFNITDAAIAEIEQYQKLEITDGKSEAVVRKSRQVVRSMRTDVEKKRKELKAPVLSRGKLIDQTAKSLTARILPTENNLDEKIKVVETRKAEEKAEREKAEALRISKIEQLINDLKDGVAACLAYNTPSGTIEALLTTLKSTEISAVDYEEFTEEAEKIKADGIAAAEAAYTDRVDWEEQQAKLAEEKAKQEAEAKRLAEENAKLEAARKAQEEEVQKKAKAEAEKRRQEEEKLRLEREALEKEKAEAAHAAVVAEREIYWEIAHEENAEFDYLRDWNVAIKENQARRAAYEATKKAKAEAAARTELIGPDIKTTQKIANTLTEYLNNFPSEFDTEEAANLTTTMISDLLTRVEVYRVAGAALK